MTFSPLTWFKYYKFSFLGLIPFPGLNFRGKNIKNPALVENVFFTKN